MTGFERYAIENGFKLTHGENKPFNTHDNCNRRYENEIGKSFIIGLFAKPTRIGILYPEIIINNEILTTLPTDELFEEVLKQIQ